MAENYSKLKAAVRKRWRQHYVEQMQARGEAVPADFKTSEPGDGDLTPPDARRVARRAACLGTVALRGLAAGWPRKDRVEFLPALQNWFASTGLDDEVEPGELQIINAAADKLDEKTATNACWRWEGAAVLAASLGRIALPPHDEVIDTEPCGEACGVFAAPAALRRLIDEATFDPSFDRTTYANRALAIHWRLRQFVHGGPKPLDFAAYAAGVDWATFDLTDVPLADGDLAIHGEPITSVDPDEVRGALSIASERHTAANWLIGWAPIYGEVENPT